MYEGVSKPALEIVQKICSFLPIADLKNVRQACGLFYYPATELLIPELTVNFALPSFERLETIASHDVLRKSVRFLGIQGCQLQTFESQNAWEARADRVNIEFESSAQKTTI